MNRRGGHDFSHLGIGKFHPGALGLEVSEKKLRRLAKAVY